jgi:ATP-dependent DNA helicase RecQ
MDAREALKRYFGFDSFRAGQEEIVSQIAAGHDALVVMPTGGGKSLCYQLPAMLLPGATLVVSPLIALMKDQVDALHAKGIDAETLNSSLNPEEQDERIEGLREGRFKLLYVAPERFGQRRFVEALRRANVSLVAVDEAHCVSQWGHDFRPDYLRIGRAVRDIGGNFPVAAFTATATPDVRNDIVKHLMLRDPKVFVTGFARENLSFNVARISKKLDKFQYLRDLVRREKTGIIYCATRKRVDEVFEEVQAWGTRVVAYHAGLTEDQRSAAQERFISRKADVAVATNAFGMGIDRADIRFVAHYEMPGSVEAYYQEAGRAGRDGLPARCDFLYSFADKRVQEFFIDGSNPGVAMVRLLWDFLKNRADAANEVRLSGSAMTEAMGLNNEMAVSSALVILMRARYVDRFDIPGQRMRGTRLLMPNLTGAQLVLDEDAMLEKEKRDNDRLQAVIDYAESGGCRQEWMLHYFGDPNARECGKCDWCARGTREGLERLDEAKYTILRKALSGVARMSRRNGANEWEGMFGVGRITEMLCGKERGPVREHGLDKLSTFGLLKEEGEDFTRALLEECIKTCLLRKSRDERPVVTLTLLGAETMRGAHIPIMLWPGKDGAAAKRERKDATGNDARDTYTARRARKAAPNYINDIASAARGTHIPILLLQGNEDIASAARDAIDDADRKPVRVRPIRRRPAKSLFVDDDEEEKPDFGHLLAELKKKRLELSRAQGVKAYQIFPDRTLEALARAKPTTHDEALNVPGVGPYKAAHVFPEFVGIIERYI